MLRKATRSATQPVARRTSRKAPWGRRLAATPQMPFPTKCRRRESRGERAVVDSAKRLSASSLHFWRKYSIGVQALACIRSSVRDDDDRDSEENKIKRPPALVRLDCRHRRALSLARLGCSVPPLTSVARLMLARADAITGPPLEPAPQKQLKSQKKTQNTLGAGQKEVEPDTPPL
jgi:hypothetical protein